MGFNINQYSSRLLPTGTALTLETFVIKTLFLIILWGFAAWLYQLALIYLAYLFYLGAAVMTFAWLVSLISLINSAIRWIKNAKLTRF